MKRAFKREENLTKEEIIEIQKELCELGVLEEIKNYTLNPKYLNEFLEKYSELSGQYGYIRGSILLPLFKRIREKYPNLSQRIYIQYS